MKTIELSAKQRQEIQERRRLAGDRRIFQRLSTLLWIDEGHTREEVADLLGVTSRQVGDWLRIFRGYVHDMVEGVRAEAAHGATLEEVQQRVPDRLAPTYEKPFSTYGDYRPWRAGLLRNIERTYAMVS